MLSLRSEAFILQSAVRAQDRTEWTGHINSHKGIVTILPNVLGSFPPLFLLRAERIREKIHFLILWMRPLFCFEYYIEISN